MKVKLSKTLLLSTFLLAGAGTGMQTSWAAAVSGVPVAADGIGGVVTGPKGPEAGVWVIAETHDLKTRYIKIVVTDDQGRYMLPQLPKAGYDVWVRGYGLVDSTKVKATPGSTVHLMAVPAPNAQAAAQYYPANYWMSLMEVPALDQFPGTGPTGNGISPQFLTQQMWSFHAKDCLSCHQMGDAPTRALANNTVEGWAERITKARGPGDQAFGDHGQDFANAMQNRMTGFGRARGLKMFADWTQKIANGALPAEAPPRPQGIERNIVLTSWDWSNGRYNHDNVSTDRLDPTVNANGPIWGIIGMWGFVEMLNPVTSETAEFGYKVNPNKNVEVLPPEKLPDAFPHNPMMDRHANVWITDLGRYGAPKPNQEPFPPVMPYCTDPNNKYAKYWPQPGVTTNTIVHYNTKTKQIEGIPFCNGTHHLAFGADRKTLYFSGGGSVEGANVVSWVDIDVWNSTKNAEKSIGWCPMVVDSNGDGTITPDRTQWNFTQRKRAGGEGYASVPQLGTDTSAFDPKKDTRVDGHLYGVDVDTSDGSMWFVKRLPFPNGIVKFMPGDNPPETCKTEFYEPPKRANGTYAAYHAKGVSVDSQGIAYAAFTSGQLGKLDRKKCKVMRGPAVADGQQCPEGWTFYDVPGPKMAGATDSSADYHYLMWLDLFDTLGLGKDIPIVAGSNSDSLLAFDPRAEKWTIMRVPYPRSFHTRGMDGRFDDIKAGWKGKGIFATYASQPVWHQEGGDDGTSGPQLVKFQVRPDPLAH